MWRFAVAVALALCAAPLGEAQAPAPPPQSQQHSGAATASEAQQRDSTARGGGAGEAAPGAEHKASKAELAKEALSEAMAKHKDAVGRADRAMKRLEDYVAGLYKGVEATRVGEDVERAAAKTVAGDAGDAEKAFREHLSALSDARAGASVGSLEDKAQKAAEGIRQVSWRQAHEMRRVMSRMQKGKKTEARELSREAQQAATAALKAAHELERAQRHAGVKERDSERMYDRAEDSLEHMRDRAEDLGDKAEDKIEGFFDRVEDIVDERSDSIGAEARHHSTALRREVSRAREQTEAKLKRAERERVEAGKKSGEAATAGADEDAKAGPAEAHHPPTSDEKDSETSKPGAPAVMLSGGAEARIATGAGFVLCGLITLSAGAGLVVSLFFSRRHIRETPLLG